MSCSPGSTIEMREIRPILPAGARLLFLGACSANSGNTYSADAPTRAATGTPDHFLMGTNDAGGALSEPREDGACRNPMVDPRDGTRLTLVQSQRGEAG